MVDALTLAAEDVRIRVVAIHTIAYEARVRREVAVSIRVIGVDAICIDAAEVDMKLKRRLGDIVGT
ncbi:MAG: hypothetical protein AAFX94_10055, partial [Myxococcota bacterium]